MEAKIKKTGEIVDVICYNTCSTIRSHQDYVSYIDSNGIEHDRESLNYYWDFEPMENTTNEHWQDVRERAAIAAMGQLIGMGRDDGYKYSPSEVANYAVVYANALIEKLKNQ